MIFSYSVRAGTSPLRRVEIEAADASEAAALAHALHEREDRVVIRNLFARPPRHASRVFEERDRRRMNFRLPRA
jgi:hypothetical protein